LLGLSRGLQGLFEVKRLARPISCVGQRYKAAKVSLMSESPEEASLKKCIQAV